jgi:hypothetical protein
MSHSVTFFVEVKDDILRESKIRFRVRKQYAHHHLKVSFCLSDRASLLSQSHPDQFLLYRLIKI